MTRVLSLAAAAGAVVATVAIFAGATGATPTKTFPEVISLPAGFQPEGLEVGRGNTFYAGSVATGAIYRGNLSAGRAHG